MQKWLIEGLRDRDFLLLRQQSGGRRRLRRTSWDYRKQVPATLQKPLTQWFCSHSNLFYCFHSLQGKSDADDHHLLTLTDGCNIFVTISTYKCTYNVDINSYSFYFLQPISTALNMVTFHIASIFCTEKVRGRFLSVSPSRRLFTIRVLPGLTIFALRTRKTIFRSPNSVHSMSLLPKSS